MRLRHDLERLTSANETIAFQGRTLFDKLTECVKYIRDNRLYTREGIADSQLMDVIAHHTHMNVDVHVVDSDMINAWIMPPIIDTNHPFYESWIRDLVGSNPHYKDDALGYIKKAGGKASGWVDRSTGKVYGVFADWVVPVGITWAFFKDKSFSDEELAAAILHELGHLETYFEYMARVVTMNQVLAAASQACFESDSFEVREQIIALSAKVLDIEVDTKKLASVPDAKIRSESVTATLLTARVEKAHSTTGTNIYDVRSWEQLADAFAVRHGAGAALATGMDKIHRLYGLSSILPWPTFLAIEGLKVVLTGGFIAGTVALTVAGAAAFAIFPVGLLMLFLTMDPNKKIYDDPEQRIATIRRQATEELKLKNLSAGRRKAVLQDLDLIKQVEDNMQDKRGFFETLSNHLIPWHYSSYKKEQTQKVLEELVSNQLFIAAAKLKNLGA